ncbi:MAG: histidinol-phosphate transaminase, partial [Myxococcota bacterium]
MTPLIAPHMLALQPYEPGKPEEEVRRELGLESIVKLASNENAFGASPRVTEALASGHWNPHRYPDPRTYDLRSALAVHHGIDRDEIILGNGSNEVIDFLYRVCVSGDDHSVFGRPSFSCYQIGAIAEQLPHTAVPLRDRVHWDVGALIDAVAPATRLLFVANPNNPTGGYIGESELRRLLTEVPEEVLVVVDEAYVEFADADDFTPATELRGLRERLMVLRTFSKAYGLAGVRVGYGIGPRELVADLNRLRAPFNVNTIAQRLALVALEDQAHLERTVRATIEQRESLRAALSERGLEVAPSQANFLLVALPRPGR